MFTVRFIKDYPEFKAHPVKPGYFIISKGFIIFLGNGDYIDVSIGSEFNGASIPWVFTFFLNRFNTYYNRASAVHDALVGEGGQPRLEAFIDGQFRALKWDEAAKVFMLVMEYDKTPKYLRKIFYEAVMLKKRPKRLINIFKKAI